MSKGIIANSVMNGAAGMLLLVTGFLSSIITARLLGPEANGIVAFSLWLVVTGASIAELGSSITMSKTLPQLQAEGFDARRRLGFASLLVTVMLCSTLLLLGLYALFFLTSEQMHWAKTAPSVAYVTGALFFVQAIGSFVKFYLIGERRLTDFFKLAMGVCLLQLIGVGAGAVLYGVEGVLVGYLLGQMVFFIATIPILMTPRDRCGVPLKYLAASSIVLSAQFLIDSIFLNRLELLFLQQFWSVEMVGFYAVGLSVANIALQLPIQMTGSLLPYYSERRHSSDDRTLPVEVFAAVTRSMAYIILPMSFGLAAISSELVRAVFGEAFARSGTVVALLALAAPSYTFMQTLSLYLLSMDRARDRLKVSLVGAAVMTLGCLAVVPFFAAEGAAMVRIGVFTIMCIIMVRQTGFGSQLSGLYVNLLKTLAASVLCAIIALGILHYINGSIGLLLAVVLGGAGYIVALKLLKAIPREDADVMLSIVEKLPGSVGKSARKAVAFIAPARAKLAEEEEPIEITVETGLAEGAGNQAALPFAFDGTIGLFKPENAGVAKRSTAVLFVNPWGLEEMCSRRFFRVTAEHFAGLGVPSLRFDYPGAGDALDVDDTVGLKIWEDAIRNAAERLKQLSGCSRIIIVAQGLGAALAQRTAPSIEGVDAVALLGPVVNGRAYLRELRAWATFINHHLGLGEDAIPEGKHMIAGLQMPDGIAAELSKVRIAAPETLAAQRYLILERPERADDTTLADNLTALGATVEQQTFKGYDRLISDPVFSRTPMEVVETLAQWVDEQTSVDPAAAPSASAVDTQSLAGDGFEEVPVRFGAFNHLVGVVTRPVGRPRGNSVVFLSTAYDRQSGWGRAVTDMARGLAREGVASIRFDSANVGDSPPRPDAPDQILYSATQNADAQAALDLLEGMVPGPLMVAGRCSGGYVAIRSAVDDVRVKAAVSINPFVYYWDPNQPVERKHVVSVPRSFEDYGQRLSSFATVKRLLKGDIDVLAATRNVIIAFSRRMSVRIAPLLEYLPSRRHTASEVKKSFVTVGKRKVPLTLIYSEGDVGLEHMYFHFGPGGRKFERHPNVRLVMLPDADHNLTPPESRRTVFAEIARLAKA
ncbi:MULTISPECIES: oligosaccharide flippase family protein [unclassified Rhizobium]|uniref:oligosaccharide flippase family protein n=1 Tax=unclassified Rhizobium TaxID=2613769 RepID=UPI001ADC0769|nr:MULTISPECIES: alpha/beta fold hydrolase [unclassified Rhizobium]MBO9126085.1 alpha/beta fold hydrolase [Rhizobium sp. 16-488-2b]MBO9176669.1 alpha/beta fold hydrolase [Rhizobium sp. 16-488-2a]